MAGCPVIPTLLLNYTLTVPSIINVLCVCVFGAFDWGVSLLVCGLFTAYKINYCFNKYITSCSQLARLMRTYTQACTRTHIQTHTHSKIVWGRRDIEESESCCGSTLCSVQSKKKKNPLYSWQEFMAKHYSSEPVL